MCGIEVFSVNEEEIFNTYEGKEVFLISALDSLGVPYTADNLKMKSFSDLIKDKFEASDAKVKYINMCNLARNKTWELLKYLEKDQTKGEIYKLHQEYAQIVTTDTRPEARFGHPVNPDFVKMYYEDKADLDMNITTALRESKNPIFLFTCGGMNIDYYFKMPSCDVKVIMKEVLTNASQHFKQTMKDIDSCFAKILEINPETEIYALGSYSMIEQKKIRELAKPLYRYFNKNLKNVCDKYENVHYVDIFGTKEFVAPNDNHPTYEGQEFIAHSVIKVMQQVNNLKKEEQSKKK